MATTPFTTRASLAFNQRRPKFEKRTERLWWHCLAVGKEICLQVLCGLAFSWTVYSFFNTYTVYQSQKVSDPFDVLGISPDSDAKTIKKSYRTFALRYHHDRNPDYSSDILTRVCKVSDRFDVLGISPDSDFKTIEKSYRTFALRYHHDRNPDYSWDSFMRVCKAYEILTDETSRANWEQCGDTHCTEFASISLPSGSVPPLWSVVFLWGVVAFFLGTSWICFGPHKKMMSRLICCFIKYVARTLHHVSTWLVEVSKDLDLASKEREDAMETNQCTCSDSHGQDNGKARMELEDSSWEHVARKDME